jgi:starch synthase
MKKNKNIHSSSSAMPMKVMHISAECYPVAKVGGLADVVGALPRYQQQAGCEVGVVMPYYQTAFVAQHAWVSLFQGQISFGSKELTYEILQAEGDPLDFALYVVRIPGLLDRAEIYGHPDEADQWIAFQHAVLHWWCHEGLRPDVVHCHDHHTGLIPFFIQHGLAFEALRGVKTVATVHNGQYQGWMDWHKALWFPAFDTWKWGLLDWDGRINPLATLIKCCDHFTAVSQGYLQELLVQSNGLEGLFAMEMAKGTGIVNGIDHRVWDPAEDPYLETHYSITHIAEGKAANKAALKKAFGLEEEPWPLLVYIGRFAGEKGADLLPAYLKEIALLPIHCLVLGSGDTGVQAQIDEVVRANPGRFGAYFGYKEALAHQLYAGADYLLMPSRVEPCGLNQLYAMRYGTVPVVRATGGLKDTVPDLEQPEGRGIVFKEATVADMVEATYRLLALEQAGHIPTLRQRLMQLNFSWEASAAQYIQIYRHLIHSL